MILTRILYRIAHWHYVEGDTDHPKLRTKRLTPTLLISAMLETLEVGSHTYIPDNECCIHTSLNILKSLVYEIARGVETSPPVETASLSVFLPHCLYKAAMVCLNDTRLAGGVDPEPSIRPLKALLGYLGMRWLAASTWPASQTMIHTNPDRMLLGKN